MELLRTLMLLSPCCKCLDVSSPAGRCHGTKGKMLLELATDAGLDARRGRKHEMTVPSKSFRTAQFTDSPVARVERLLRGCSHKPQHAAEAVHLYIL